MQENSMYRINVIILRLNFGEQKYPPKGRGGYESINILVNAVLTLKTLIFLNTNFSVEKYRILLVHSKY